LFIPEVFETDVILTNVTMASGFDMILNSLKTSYILDGKEYEIIKDKE
jgi:hypothetical protein